MLEYQLPLTSRRLDFMVTGKGQGNSDNAVIVELKQWEKCGAATHTAFHEGDNPVSLAACAYLHNYPYDSEDVLYDRKFDGVLKSNPIFTMHEHRSNYQCRVAL